MINNHLVRVRKSRDKMVDNHLIQYKEYKEEKDA